MLSKICTYRFFFVSLRPIPYKHRTIMKKFMYYSIGIFFAVLSVCAVLITCSYYIPTATVELEGTTYEFKTFSSRRAQREYFKMAYQSRDAARDARESLR